MKVIENIEELEAIYGEVSEGAKRKGATHLTPLYEKWITASRFCVMATVGTDGTDASPRGDDGPVVRIADLKTLLMPDWRGNNRLDSLRNIVSDDRVSLMFMINKVKDVVRVNGRAVLTTDQALRDSFRHNNHVPTCVIKIAIHEVYIHCPKSILRSKLWDSGPDENIPTIGEILREVTDQELGGHAYDAVLKDRLGATLWS